MVLRTRGLLTTDLLIYTCLVIRYPKKSLNPIKRKPVKLPLILIVRPAVPILFTSIFWSRYESSCYFQSLVESN